MYEICHELNEKCRSQSDPLFAYTKEWHPLSTYTYKNGIC